MFCQEDRAMLCTECDIPIHKANELTQKHNRFLLTGVRLSASSSASSSNASDFATESQMIKSFVSNKLPKPNSYQKGPSLSQENSVPNTSSISEYLMETLPGWLVDDFLDPPCFPPGLCKICRKLDTLLEHTQHTYSDTYNRKQKKSKCTCGYKSLFG